MRLLDKISGALLSSLVVLGTVAQDNKQMLSDFKSSNWQLVKSAKNNIENLQGVLIPDLIQLLDSKDKIKLENSGSLIYPGAEKFFGHGQILDYDIDYISIRAGWLIEEISFNNFGFTGIHLPKDELVDYIRITFPDYYNNSGNRKKVEVAEQAELRSIVQGLAIRNAKEWWTNNVANFSRLESLVQALRSFDEKRQVKALFYMRNGTTKCDGISKDYYYNELIKEIGRLSGSDVQRISEHAKLILMDTKFEWLVMKEQ